MAAPKKRLISVVESSSDGNINDVKDSSEASNEIARFVFTDVIGEDNDEESKNTSTFVYKKLVVPMNMRSVYWKCYGFPANDEGEILTKVKIICILCKTVISYNGNTSNLRMHLKSKHPQELQNLELGGSFKGNKKPRVDVKEKRRIKRQQQRVAASSKTVSYVYSTTTDGAVHLNKNVDIVSDPNISLDELNDSTSTVKVLMKSEEPSHDNENLTTTYHLMQDDHHSSVASAGVNAVGEEEEEELELQVHSEQSVFERKTISDAIAEFIILDLQLPQVVESAGFQNLVATLRSPCEIPSRVRLVEDIIPKLYNTFRESILEDLSCASSDISLTVEEWKSDYGQKNVTITAHYLQQGQEDRLQSKVLLTHNCSPLYDIKHWSLIFDTLLTTWNINTDKVKAVVVATTEEFLLMALRSKSFTLIPCLTFTLQEACMSGCFSYPDVDCVVRKIRLLLSLLYRCSNAVTVLRLQEHLLQLEDVSLVLDYPKIWISTYTMLEQLLARRSIMKLVTDAIDASLYEKELLDITDEDWSLIEDVVNVLEPFKVTTMTLAEEKTPLISLLKPLVWQLISVHLKVREDTDSPLSQKIKLDLTEILKNKYSEESVDTMLKTATTLDPRFKQLPYAIEEVKAMLNGPIKVELIRMMEQASTLSLDNNEKNQLNLKKSRLSGMEFLLGDLCTTSNSLSTNERAELEINQYQSEPTANLDHCPLIWWQKANIKFPNLAKLVSSYNCIPVTAIPPNRIPVESQISYDIKRAKILPEIIDKLVFLNANKPITF